MNDREQFIENLEVEKAELDARVSVLEATLNGNLGIKLLPMQVDLMVQQLHYMKAYSQILGERYIMESTTGTLREE